jgi:DNA polymerase
MPDETRSLTPEQLARVLRQHLASLAASGVEWLPLSRSPLPVLLPQSAAPTEAAEEPAAAATDSAATRRQELEVLAERVAGCTRCPALAATRTQTVFGVGKIDPDLCVVGEAPGADEDAQGEPFVGPAGQMLTRILAACGLKREDVFICNIIKCRPPRNRTPEAEEAHNCREYLERQLELVRPKFICAFGGTAAKYLLNTSRGIGSLRGKLHDYQGIPVVCTYHPSYLLPHRTNGDKEVERERKRLVWEDMKFLLAQMGRPVEKK